MKKLFLKFLIKNTMKNNWKEFIRISKNNSNMFWNFTTNHSKTFKILFSDNHNEILKHEESTGIIIKKISNIISVPYKIVN